MLNYRYNRFDNIVRDIIYEGAETRNMKLAKHYLYKKCGYDESTAMKVIGSIKTDIPNVRLCKCKFILGITRMFIEGELSDGESIMGINKTLKYIASDVHVNEYDNDLNGMHCNELIERFSDIASAELEGEKDELSQMEFGGSDYRIVKVPDFETAEQYGEYTSWCVTQDPDMYNNYTHGGLGLFYFCLKNGFENLDEVKGEGCPLDEYGLSMIAVSVNQDGSCNTITCRWNHGNGGNDSIMTPKELSNIIGYNFYDVFKPYTEEELIEKKKIQFNAFEDIADRYLNFYIDGFGTLEDYCVLLYDSEYDEDFDDGEFYDVNGELCSTDDWGWESNYQYTHLKYIVVSSDLLKEQDGDYGIDEGYLIYEYCYGSVSLLIDKIIENYDYNKEQGYLSITDIDGKCNIYDCNNRRYLFNEDNDIDRILHINDVLCVGAIHSKSNDCYYFYDIKNNCLYDETPFADISYSYGGARDLIEVKNSEHRKNIYSLKNKSLLFDEWYYNIQCYYNRNGKIYFCFPNEAYPCTLFALMDDGSVKRLTDNEILGLGGYYDSAYIFAYRYRNDIYYYDFDTHRIFKGREDFKTRKNPVNLLTYGNEMRESIKSDFRVLLERINRVK